MADSFAVTANFGQQEFRGFRGYLCDSFSATSRRMELIDKDWIEARLTGKRGEKSRLAAAMGIDADKMSKILAGERRVQAHEIPAILAFFDMQAEGQPTGMAEGASTPFHFPDHIPKDWFLNQVAPNLKQRETLRVRVSMPFFGLLRGDVVVVSVGQEPSEGDICVVNQVLGLRSVTIFLRKVGALMLSADPTEPPIDPDPDDPDFAIMGTVVAVLRTPTL
jgi:hypothetical protein